jgi:hypothetical protein
MNEMSLSRLYRRLMSERAQPAVDVDDLVAVAASSIGADRIDSARRDSVVASLAKSSKYADLARMLGALLPASESLATDIRMRDHSAHPSRLREQRIAAGAKRGHRMHRMRWVAGIAACLSVALGLWSWHHEDVSRPAVTAMRSGVSSSDRIFTSNDVIFASSNDSHRQMQRYGGSGDELFRGNFSG